MSITIILKNIDCSLESYNCKHEHKLTKKKMNNLGSYIYIYLHIFTCMHARRWTLLGDTMMQGTT